jgi:biopolymer transport protein TolR
MAIGTKSKSGKKAYVSEINVTPFVDVMLVLLIIFMVTAPMMTTGLDVKLPETTAEPIPQKKDPVIITIKGDGSIHLNDTQVNIAELKRRLSHMKRSGNTRQVLLRADKAVAYGIVAEAVAATRKAGILDLGLVTKPADSEKGNEH